MDFASSAIATDLTELGPSSLGILRDQSTNMKEAKMPPRIGAVVSGPIQLLAALQLTTKKPLLSRWLFVLKAWSTFAKIPQFFMQCIQGYSRTILVKKASMHPGQKALSTTLIKIYDIQPFRIKHLLLLPNSNE
jgi:hypothetical protein